MALEVSNIPSYAWWPHNQKVHENLFPRQVSPAATCINKERRWYFRMILHQFLSYKFEISIIIIRGQTHHRWIANHCSLIYYIQFVSSFMVRIATWNVNSVRSRMPGILRFIREYQIDVLMMQEIKCQEFEFPLSLFEEEGYHAVVNGQKGRHGVAIIAKKEHTMYNEFRNLPSYQIDDNDSQSRYIETKLKIKDQTFKIGNIYVPNGTPPEKYTGNPIQSETFHYKLRFLDRLTMKMEEARSDDEIVIFGGDYNIMHLTLDVYNPLFWGNKINFLPVERNKLDSMMQMGYVDAFRLKNPGIKGYTWWDYRHRCWQNKFGLRLDYMLINEYGMKRLKHCGIISSPRGWQKPSDHAPMISQFNL